MSDRGCVVVWTLCTVFMAKVLLAVVGTTCWPVVGHVQESRVHNCERFSPQQGPHKTTRSMPPITRYHVVFATPLSSCVRTAQRRWTGAGRVRHR